MPNSCVNKFHLCLSLKLHGLLFFLSERELECHIIGRCSYHMQKRVLQILTFFSKQGKGSSAGKRQNRKYCMSNSVRCSVILTVTHPRDLGINNIHNLISQNNFFSYANITKWVVTYNSPLLHYARETEQ